MTLNKQCLKMFNVTEEDYRNWCKDNDKYIHNDKSKKEFFYKLENKQLIRDVDGRLVEK